MAASAPKRARRVGCELFQWLPDGGSRQTGIRFSHGSGATAEVNLHGATLTSWKVEGAELIFVSDSAVYNGATAIRGGIPVCFPQFGPWDLGPSHGFARILPWKFLPQESGTTPSGDVFGSFRLRDDKDTTEASWPGRQFLLTLVVTLSEGTLSTNLTVENIGKMPLEFTALLHTYLKVPAIADVTVSGLQGVEFVDKVADETATEERKLVELAENVDRVYKGAVEPHTVSNVSSSRPRGKFDHSSAHTKVDVVVAKCNLPDTVVWNPWIEKAKAMGDLGDDDYKQFVCVEAGSVSVPVCLQMGERWDAGQKLSRVTRS